MYKEVIPILVLSRDVPVLQMKMTRTGVKCVMLGKATIWSSLTPRKVTAHWSDGEVTASRILSLEERKIMRCNAEMMCKSYMSSKIDRQTVKSGKLR